MSKTFDALKRAEESVGKLGSDLLLRIGESQAMVIEDPALDARQTAQDAASPPPEPPPIQTQQMRVVNARIGGDDQRTDEFEEPKILEQFRLIRSRLTQHPYQPRLITVTSASKGDGKTMTAMNVAGIFALRPDVSVALVETDLRRSCMATNFGIGGSLGLANVLAGRNSIEEAMVRLEQLPSLHVMPAGKTSENPAELFESPRWQQTCDQLRASFDYVIFDAPPAGMVAESDWIVRRTDGVLLVVRLGQTEHSALRDTLELIPKDKLLGAVVNCSFQWLFWKTRDYSAYYRDTETPGK
ncbi:MAG: CpsD/CapB family tyrosine-protein kinase [Bryobacterales bacterium]|nr:CpsD/CapB family tyrosine-protein kinase [Bryobacterales bacterium]